MSRYSLPILILNLGGEMFYVLDQRLKAQKVPPDRAQKVLNEIASVMLSEKFLEELFKPQQLYSKHELFLLFKEIAHASIMKLNDISMGKLYDLMIMVFKYQMYFVSRPRDILLVTLNHMDSLRNFVSSSFVYKQLDSVHFLLTQVHYPMRDADLQMIRYDLLNYVQDIHIKVSIFLRLGQQNNDGTFVNPTNESVPYGIEVPGLIKIFNQDQSIKDITAFPPRGAYTNVDVEGSLDFKGNRGIELGLSIYHEKILQDFSWSYSENRAESQILKASKELVYRSEMNTFMNQLTGCRSPESKEETIFLDLCSSIGNEVKIVKDVSNIQTVTLEDSLVRQNTILENAAEEVNICLTQQKQDDLLYLLENTE